MGAAPMNVATSTQQTPGLEKGQAKGAKSVSRRVTGGVVRVFVVVAGCAVLGACTTVAIAWVASVVVRPAGSELRYRLPALDQNGATIRSVPYGFRENNMIQFVNWGITKTEGYRDISFRFMLDERSAPEWSCLRSLQRTENVERVARANGADYGRRFEAASGWPFVAMLSHSYESPAFSTALEGSGSPLRRSAVGSGPPQNIPPGVLVAPPAVTPYSGTAGLVNVNGIQLPDWTSDDGWERWPRVLPLVPYWPGFIKNSALFAALWCCGLFAVPALRRKLRTRRGLCAQCGYDRKGIPSGNRCPECGGLSGNQRSV